MAEYWLADTDRREVQVFVLPAGSFVPAGTYTTADTLTSPLLPQLAAPVNELFI